MSKLLGLLVILMAILVGQSADAAEHESQRDARAIEVLKAMSNYLSGLESFEITGTSLEDSMQDDGLMVTDPIEIHLAVDRPGSFHLRQFDGVGTKELYIHEGNLALYDSQNGFYALADVPEGLDAGLDYALEELGIDLPLMDLVFHDSFKRLAGTSDPLIYVTDKARVAGVDCHQLAIRVEGADVQLWVQKGDRPLPRRMIITSIWEGGSPRFIAVMNWNVSPEIAPGVFEFEPPEGAAQINFEPAD
jgi:hypothetical protein